MVGSIQGLGGGCYTGNNRVPALGGNRGRRWLFVLLAALISVTLAALIRGSVEAETPKPTRARGGVLMTMTPAPGATPPPGGGSAQMFTTSLPGWVPQLQLCGIGLAVLAGGGGLVYFVFYGRSKVELKRARQLDELRRKEARDKDEEITRTDRLNETLKRRIQWAQAWRQERMAELEAFDPDQAGGVLGPNSRLVFDLAVDRLAGSADVRTLRRLAQHSEGVPYRFTEELLKRARFTEASGWPILTCIYREERGEPRDWYLIAEGQPQLPGYAARPRWYFRPVPDELIEDMARYRHRCTRVLL